MTRLPKTHSPPNNNGAVLLLALVFMLMMAITAATVMDNAILQMHMAGNDQFFEEAFYKAQAIATELSLNSDNFSLEGGSGYINCPSSAQDSVCDISQLTTVVSSEVPAGVELDYKIIRQDPLLWRGFPIRESQDTVSSSASFDAAIFEISVRINGSEKRLGSVHLAQGIALRVASFR